MRVHLINPPAANGIDMVREGRCMQRAGAWTAVWSPISLATIAAVLQQNGFECKLDDCIIEGLSIEQAMQRARDFNAQVFVVNTATPSIVQDLSFIDRLKKESPKALTMAIGIHVTALPGESLAMCKGLDAVVRGEPELTVKDAAPAFFEGRPLKHVPGLSTREGDDIMHGPERSPADLDALPFPAWELVRIDLYKLPIWGRPFLLIGTSRGCPYHCAFCADPAYYGHVLRVKSPERIVAELEHARDTFGIRDFLFWSESFTLKPVWTRQVLEAIIRADLDVRFVCNSRADHVGPELLSLMKDAGCWMIGFGLESGSQRVLDLMNKRIKLRDNVNAVNRAKQAGLMTTAHMVIGYPGETEQEIMQTIDFACSLPLDFAQFYCAVPFPGSELYDMARKEGWLGDSPWRQYEQNMAVMSCPGMTPERLMKLRRLAYRRFYARPSQVWRVFSRNPGLKSAVNLARMARSFMEWT